MSNENCMKEGVWMVRRNRKGQIKEMKGEMLNKMERHVTYNLYVSLLERCNLA